MRAGRIEAMNATVRIPNYTRDAMPRRQRIGPKPTPADKAATARVLAAMPNEMREAIRSIHVVYCNCAIVTLKRNDTPNDHALAFDIADRIESALGQPYQIGVYRPNREIVYQRFLR
jgi:hypothetical protein